MIIDLFILIIVFYLAIPFVAGYTAKSYGRKFWFWFITGCILPALAHLALYLIIKKDLKINRLLSLMSSDEVDYMDMLIQDVLEERKIIRHLEISRKGQF